MGCDTVVLDGDFSLVVEGQAEFELLISESGEFGAFTAIRQSYPAYEGSYEATPSNERQIFSTTLKTMFEDFVVNPIPSNYGLITWDGTTLTVS